MENKVIVTTAIVVDIEPDEKGHSARFEDIVRRLGDAVQQAFAQDAVVEPLMGFACDWLNDLDTNFARCADCHRLVSDYGKPHAIRVPMASRAIDGTVVCEECACFRRQSPG